MYDPASDLGIFMYAEDGSPKNIVYFDTSENRKVEKTISPGKTASRIRLGFTAKVVDNVGSNIIEMIEIDSPLEKAGVKRGDRIIMLDDTPVKNTEEIINYLNVTRTDKTAPVKVTVERNGTVMTFENIQPFSDFQYTLGVSFEHKKATFLMPWRSI